MNVHFMYVHEFTILCSYSDIDWKYLTMRKDMPSNAKKDRHNGKSTMVLLAVSLGETIYIY